ncbi:helix-hairpin-helix domain-containing protein [Anaeromyxobacter oryzae]|nr:helix-hairpin-helix domain-containing protein [Anaeromyxobacter oryzae]
MADKFEVARLLREIGALLELEGENPFKIRAYENGARAVEAVAEDVAALAAEGRLTDVPGIGEALAKKIADILARGSTDVLDRLRAKHPPGVLDLLRVPDLGPKKIAALHGALGVGSVDELEAACLAGRVRGVKGFGEKTEAKILEGIRRLRARPAEVRVLLAGALEAADAIVAFLRRSPAALDVQLAGSARRGRETVGDLDVVAASRAPAELSAHFLAFPLVKDVIARGDTKTSVRLASGLQVDLRIVPPEDFATLLHHFTGSKAHHVKLRGIARDQGLTLSEWGLYRLPPRPARGGARADGDPGASAVAEVPLAAEEAPPDPSAKVSVGSEAELYRALGLAYIPPELREDTGELEAARAGRVPEDLVTLEDVRGLVHCHTTWSDGKATLLDMARAAEALGVEYLTVTDHSGTAHYAGGLDPDRLRRQWDEIARVQEQVGIRLLRGTEADILDDGALDWPDAILEQLEVVVASIHSRMKMDEAQMTARLVRAMSWPVFKIWGHGTGRLLNERPPYAVRVEEVLDALARSRGAVEVNGDPQRLDLEPRHVRAARDRGIPVVLSVDAHSTGALRYLRYAVLTARRGWVRRGDVLNTLPADAFARAVRPVA